MYNEYISPICFITIENLGFFMGRQQSVNWATSPGQDNSGATSLGARLYWGDFTNIPSLLL